LIFDPMIKRGVQGTELFIGDMQRACHRISVRLQDASAEWNVVAGEIIRFDSPQDDERPWHCNALHAVLVMAMASE
jgi:hypothetical protein